MQLERSVPSRVGPPATRHHSIAPGTLALICASLVALAASTWLGVLYLSTNDPCALPPGAASLSAQAQATLARHVMACRDLEHGRITLADYRQIVGAELPATRVEPAAIQWASSVRAVSSQYSNTDWSAQQVLGPPDVYPRSGDNTHAWASLDADAPWEFIEVGFATPEHIRGLQVVETLAPGAISRVEIITETGKRRIVYDQQSVEPAKNASQITPFAFLCTDEKIVAARVTLASGQVPGWNEIDAIGAIPCR